MNNPYSTENNFLLYFVKNILLPMVIGLGILWYLYRDVDFSEIWNVLNKDVNIPVLLFGLTFGFIAHAIRGLRWHLLVKPIAKDRKIDIRNSVFIVLGSYAVNMVIPRAGELWRCWTMHRHEKLGFDKLFGTLITDRIIDVLMLLIMIFFVGFLFSSEFCNLMYGIKGYIKSNDAMAFMVKNWAFTLLLVIVLLLIGYYVLKVINRKKNNKFLNIIKGVFEGVKTVLHMEHKTVFIIESLLIWLCYFLFFYINFYAFPFTEELGWRVGLIIFTFSTISSIVPVQGGIGAWHLFVISSLVLFGISKSDAHSFAFIVHTLQTITITLVGIISIFLLPLINKNKKYEPNSK